jgi:hypothetical protein
MSRIGFLENSGTVLAMTSESTTSIVVNCPTMRVLSLVGIALVLLGCGSSQSTAMRDAASDGTPSIFDMLAGQNNITGSISVPGGTRDLSTTHCTSTTGDATCPVPDGYTSCIKGKCATSLTDCYYSDGISSAVGGLCRSYANCMLACPCDTGQSKCEDDCLQKYAATNTNCWTCLINFRNCSSHVDCPPISDCVTPERSPQLVGH